MTDFSTTQVPDAVVNQRAHVGIYATADGNRGGGLAIGVYLDQSRDDQLPFLIASESFRGWDGDGLTEDERRYIGGLLYQAALLVLEPAP